MHRHFASNATVRCLEVGGGHISEVCLIKILDYISLEEIEKSTISRCSVTLNLLFSGFKSSASTNLAPENQDMMKVIVRLKVS